MCADMANAQATLPISVSNYLNHQISNTHVSNLLYSNTQGKVILQQLLLKSQLSSVIRF